MSQGMDTATEILKEVYVGTINDQINTEPTAYNRFKSTAGNAAKYGGKYVDFPVHIGRNTGIGAREEREALPVAGKQTYREAMLKLKSFYGAFELTGQAFDLAENDYQSFNSLVKEESTRIKDDLVEDRNRQLFGNGTGIIGTVISVSGNDVVVDTNRGFQDGMRVTVYTGTSTTPRIAETYVNDIETDYSGVSPVYSITLASASGVVAGDSIARHGNGGQREWLGLSAIVDDASSLYGISHQNGENGSRHWRANVNNNGGTPTAISEAMLARMTDRIKEAGGKTTAIYTTPGVLRAYYLLLEGKRSIVNTQKFAGGYTGLTFTSPQGEIPMIADSMCQPGTMYFLNEKEIQIYRPYEYKLIDRGGSTWKMKQTEEGTHDIWQAWLVEHSEIGTKRRNTHGKITNIMEDAY